MGSTVSDAVTVARLRDVLIGARRLGFVLCLVVAAMLSLSVASAQAANVTGRWVCCGSGGAGAQDFDITDSGGSLSGEGLTPDGADFATISGSQSGDSVTIVTTYTAIEAGYVATFVGTVSSSDLSMSGTWTSNRDQSGTWTATSSGFSVSGTLTSVDCTATSCSLPTGVPDVTVSVASTDGGGISTSGVSGSDGTYSVTVPAGAYSVTPGGDLWSPAEQDETVQADTPNVDFSECGSSGASADLLRSGAPFATTAAASKRACTKTLVTCTNTYAPTPTVCIVAVKDISAAPTVPTGTVEFDASTTGTAFNKLSHWTATEPLRAVAGSGKAAVTYQQFVLGVPGTWTVSASYVPDAAHFASINGTMVAVQPEPTQSVVHITKEYLTIGGDAMEHAGAYELGASGGMVVVSGGVASPLAGALAGWGAITYGIGDLEILIAKFIEDPPDPSYQTVAVPHVPRTPAVSGGTLVRQLLSDAVRFRALEAVLATTINRAASAGAAGATADRTAQMNAAITYVGEMVSLIKSEISLQRKFAVKVRHLGKIKLGGFKPSSEATRILRLLGVSPAGIEKTKAVRTVNAATAVLSPIKSETKLEAALEQFAKNPVPGAYPTGGPFP